MKKNDLLSWMQSRGMGPTPYQPVQGFAFGGIANPAQRAALRRSDQEYLDKRLQELNAYEAQRAAYNTGLTKYQDEVFKPYQAQSEAYNTAAQKYNEEIYNPYKSQYDSYEKAIADYNAGPRTTDYAGPAEPTLASRFEMTAPTTPEAFAMVAPTVPFREEDVAAYQQEAAQTARSDAADRSTAIDVVSDPSKYNFGSMSVSNRFMAEGGLVEDERLGLEAEEPMAQSENNQFQRLPRRPRPEPTAADALERLARSLDDKTYTDSVYQGSKGPSTVIDGKKYLVDEETGKVLNNIELNPDTLTSEYSMLFPRSSAPSVNTGEEGEREDTMTDEGVSTKEPDLDFIRRVAPDERIASDTFMTSLPEGPNSQSRNMLQKMTSIVAKAGRGEDRQLAHLSPEMLGGRENAGIMTDRLGNKIYSPGAKPLLYKAGGEVDISSINSYLLQDPEEDPINTDPVGSARKLLADLTGPKQSVTEITQSPNAKSIKRISKKSSAGGPGVSKGMSLEYEALSSAKDLVPTLGDQGSARSQMEALATAYKLKAKQATNKARGLMQDTMGAPTLEQPTLTKVGLTAKRFDKGGEVTILGARMAEDEPTAVAPAPLVTEPVVSGRRAPRRQNAQENLQALKDVAERTVSLDPQPDANLADTAVDIVGGFIPGVSQALAARDIERARRDDDKLGMALAASSFIPFGKAYNAAKSRISRAPGGYFPTSRTPGVEYSDLDKMASDITSRVKDKTETGPQRNALLQMFDQKMKDFFTKQAGSIKDPLRSDILSGKIKFLEDTPMGDYFPKILIKSANKGDIQALRLLEKNYDTMFPIKTFLPYKEGDVRPDVASVTTGIMASIRENLNSIPDGQLLAYAGKKPLEGPDGVAKAAAEVRQKLKDNPTLFSTVLEPNIARTLFPSVRASSDEDIARYAYSYSQELGERMVNPGQVLPKDGPIPKGYFLPELQTAIDKNQPILASRAPSRILGLDHDDLLTQALKFPTKDLEQASFTDFIKKAYQSKQVVDAYERELKKVKPQIQKGAAPPASVMTQYVKDFLPVKNDMRWVKVTNPDGVKPIAAGMDNSVGSYANFGTYGSLNKGRAALEGGEVEIFALYNKDNIPQVTVEYVTNQARVPANERNRIVQLTGNGPLTVNDLPENFTSEIVSLANALKLDKNGLPSRIDNLLLNKNIAFKDGQWTGLNK